MPRLPAPSGVSVSALLLATLGLGGLPGCGSSPVSEAEGDGDPTTHDVVIVGGGAAGLSALHFLKDYDAILLEKETRVGGRAVAGRRGEVVFAQGAEYIGQADDALLTLVRDLKIELSPIPEPMDVRWQGGQLYWGDDGLAQLLVEGSSIAEYNRFVAAIQGLAASYAEIPDYDPEGPLSDLDDVSAADWLSANGYAEIYRRVYDTASRGLFGATLDEISMLSLVNEAAFDFEGTGAITEVDEADNRPDPTGADSGACSFAGGLAPLTKAMADAYPDRIRLGHTVTAVAPGDDEYTVSYTGPDGTAGRLTASVVILAVPAPVAVQLAGNALTGPRRELLGQIPYAGYATLALFSAEPIFTGAFDLAALGELSFTDVYDSNWMARHDGTLADPPAEHIVSLYLAPKTYADRTVVTADESALVARALTDLDRLWPGASNKVTGHALLRHPYAYPVMTKGAYARLAALDKLNTGALLLAGDYTIYPTLEAAVESGQVAAERAIEEL